MRRIFFTLAFLGLFLSSAIAEEALTPRPTEVLMVESYLNKISTLRAKFIQTANDGKQTTGTFLLSRPGKMRFDYDPPVKDFIVSDGILIYYYDGQMKQQTSTLISQSLADFFLRKKIRLSGDIRVSGIRHDDGLLRLTLTQAKDPRAGSLMLVLNEKPMQLKEWAVIDSQGLVTRIALKNIETGIDLKGSLFHYYNPVNKDHPYN